MIKKFEELDADGSGKLDVDEAKAGLQASGLGEKEVDFFINSTKGGDGQIERAQFANLLFRLKVYEEKSKKKKK
jgi:Ca2+-binding EF-hand superfamily protein